MPHSEKEGGCHIVKKKRKRIAAFEKDNLCVREQRKIREIFIFYFFYSHETYTRIIVIDLIIVKLFGVCPVVFPFKEKGFST